MEQRTRARVILVGGDARTLRALRLFLDALGIFEAVAVATGGAGLNAMTRQPWSAAVVVDDLHDMVSEELIGSARNSGFAAPVVGLVPVADRHRVSALYEAGAAEVMTLGAAPSPDLARALARCIERQELIERIKQLESSTSTHRVVDEETGLYSPLRFEEDWRLEQVRAKRRGSDLTVLSVRLETVTPIAELPARDRTTLLRAAARGLRGAMREGDIACHDGDGSFRVLLSDANSMIGAEQAGRIRSGVGEVLRMSAPGAEVTVDLLDSFESVMAGVAR